MAEFPARIHVLLARDSPRAVVIRRGPSKEVASILWDRSTDEFSLGQWLKGRIYGMRSDISPDGEYWIYFAMNGYWSSEAQGSWTAVAKVPYLKALACLPKGDCWDGGGLWTTNRAYWLNDGLGHSILRDTTLVRRDVTYVGPHTFCGECPAIYYPRLLRDGWTESPPNTVVPATTRRSFDRSLPGGWILRKFAHAQSGSPPGKGCYWDEHCITRTDGESTLECKDWEWADFDGKRILWARHGRIYAGSIGASGCLVEVELADLNGMRFRGIEAPYE